jgi:hypothetical protein
VNPALPNAERRTPPTVVWDRSAPRGFSDNPATIWSATWSRMATAVCPTAPDMVFPATLTAPRASLARCRARRARVAEPDALAEPAGSGVGSSAGGPRGRWPLRVRRERTSQRTTAIRTTAAMAMRIAVWVKVSSANRVSHTFPLQPHTLGELGCMVMQ